ncbi:MAG TPA: hypothetical protein VG917_05145 [Patescibacteria group bacterium]|nr:hypothetical protein [Patescibacteria group bacterium]
MSLSHEYPNNGEGLSQPNSIIDLVSAKRECEDLGEIGLRFSGGKPGSVQYTEGIELLTASSRALKIAVGMDLGPEEELVGETHFDPVLFSEQVFGVDFTNVDNEKIQRNLSHLSGTRNLLEGLDGGEIYSEDTTKTVFKYVLFLGAGFSHLSTLYKMKIDKLRDPASYY